jgi:predicted HTH transcriptional regulator
MSALISFIIGVFLGGIVVWVFMRGQKQHSNILENVGMSDKAGAGNLAEFNKERAEKEIENKQKILDHAKGDEKVFNADIQKLLNISDATAERYLDELEKEGKLKQVQEVGRGVYYQKP